LCCVVLCCVVLCCVVLCCGVVWCGVLCCTDTTATTWAPYFSLMLLLVYEACYNPTSFWEPYFHLLPLEFPGR
jgi:hypothetical protein